MPRIPVATPQALASAIATLGAADPGIARVIRASGPCGLHRHRRRDVSDFASLTGSIVAQQVSGAAAATIHGRFAALFPGGVPDAASVGGLSDVALRGAGLSRAKVAAIRDLAAHVVAGTLPLDRVRVLPDEEVIRALVDVRGIGRWTAQMFLMFRLGRLDVWPVADLGVQKGVQAIRRLRSRPDPVAVERHGERWRPFRSVAAWYCWRAVELADD